MSEEKNIKSVPEEEEEREQKEGEEDESSGVEDEGDEDEDAEQVDPAELLALGKKCLAAGDATNALEYIQEACSVLAERHGQVSKELAEPYYLYGRALLEVAREKNTVFGQGVPGGSTGDTADAPSSSSSLPSGSQGSGSGSNGVTGGTISNGAGASSSSNGGGATSEGSTSSREVNSAADISETGGGRGKQGASADGEQGDNQGEEEEEESDLKLAWEILELARIICQREKGRDYQLKLSDVNLLLGEVGLECDQYSQAITDFQSSLRLRMFLLEPTDRRIAEVHFHLGLAFMLDKQGDEAVAAYRSAKDTLVKRAEYLREKAQCEGSEDLAEEVSELEEVIKDVESKVSDAQELQKVLEEKAREDAQVESNEAQFSSSFDKPDEALSKPSQIAVKKAPVNDIGHLIRKRKVNSDDGSGGEGERDEGKKKMKLENGRGTVAGPELVQTTQQNSGQ